MQILNSIITLYIVLFQYIIHFLTKCINYKITKKNKLFEDHKYYKIKNKT